MGYSMGENNVVRCRRAKSSLWQTHKLTNVSESTVVEVCYHQPPMHSSLVDIGEGHYVIGAWLGRVG